MKQFNNVKIGADPEFFLFRNGKPYPVVGILGGGKDEPVDCSHIGPWCGYLEDNVMPEYNIPPCTNADDFVKFNNLMIEHIMGVVGSDYTANFMPAHRFEPQFLETDQARTFGCMPDHNAYSLQLQHPNAEEAQNLRTAGGHIHIGWDTEGEDFEAAAAIARAFDLFCTMPFMLIEPDNERRQLYGKAGSMRVKWYGVECRQLSCFWLSDEKWMRWVFNQTLQAVKFVEQNEEIWDPNSELCKAVQNIIDNKLMGEIIPLMKHVGVDTTVLESVLV